jgi:hypothetical protein
MALGKCRECGNQVSSEAVNCPHCGVPKPVTVQSDLRPVEVGEPVTWRITHRSLGRVVVLNLVTLGLYGFYLIYQWAADVNGLVGRRKYKAGLMLLISIVTLGVGGAIIEAIYAHEVSSEAKRRHIPDAIPYLVVFVGGLNAIAWALGIFGGWAWGLMSLPIGVTSTVLIQRELNLFVDQPLHPYAAAR